MTWADVVTGKGENPKDPLIDSSNNFPPLGSPAAPCSPSNTIDKSDSGDTQSVSDENSDGTPALTYCTYSPKSTATTNMSRQPTACGSETYGGQFTGPWGSGNGKIACQCCVSHIEPGSFNDEEAHLLVPKGLMDPPQPGPAQAFGTGQSPKPTPTIPTAFSSPAQRYVERHLGKIVPTVPCIASGCPWNSLTMQQINDWCKLYPKWGMYFKSWLGQLPEHAIIKAIIEDNRALINIAYNILGVRITLNGAEYIRLYVLPEIVYQKYPYFFCLYASLEQRGHICNYLFKTYQHTDEKCPLNESNVPTHLLSDVSDHVRFINAFRDAFFAPVNGWPQGIPLSYCLQNLLGKSNATFHPVSNSTKYVWDSRVLYNPPTSPFA